MENFRYHFIFQKQSNTQDAYFPVLGKVFYKENEPINWEPAVFHDEFKSLSESYQETMKESNLMRLAKVNFPIVVGDDNKLSFFHPNEDISFNENHEITLNYAYDEEKSSLINIDLDDETIKSIHSLGADMVTVEGTQKFYELLGKAFIEFIENADDIDDSEKERLIQSLKISNESKE
jgi:hypothetical protein